MDVAETGISDKGWTLSGVITITNPNDWEDIMLTGLTDVVDNGDNLYVNPTLPLVPKGGSVECQLHLFVYNCTQQLQWQEHCHRHLEQGTGLHPI